MMSRDAALSLLPEGNGNGWTGFAAPHYAKVEHGGRDQSEARLRCREGDQLPNSSQARPLRPPGPPSMNFPSHRRPAGETRVTPSFHARHHLAACPSLFPSPRTAGPGRILLAAVIAIELSIVAINVMLNQWNNRFYNALQERNWDDFVCELLFFCALAAAFIVLAVYQLYLNQWLQIRWRHWMTRAVSRPLACQRQPLPHAASRRRRRQPRPAHRRGHQPLHRAHVDDQRRPAQRHRHARSPSSSSCGRLSAAAPLHLFGTSFAIPGLSGLGGACSMRSSGPR